MTENTTAGRDLLSRQLRKECVLREGEEFDAWAARNKWLPLPVFIFQTVYDAILDFARTSNEKNRPKSSTFTAHIVTATQLGQSSVVKERAVCRVASHRPPRTGRR
jgi:hypothetical protein